MNDALFNVIVVQIFGIVGMYVKSWIDKRIAKKEATNREKEYTNREVNFQKKILESQSQNINMQMEIQEIKQMLKDHVIDNDFPIIYKDALYKVSNEKLLSYRNLDPGHSMALNFWLETIEKFGLRFYYSSLRHGDKDSLKLFLQTQIDIKIGELDSIIREHINDSKVYKASRIYFNTFINSNQKHHLTNVMPIHYKTDVLIIDMVNNGLDQEKMINLFKKYIREFYDAYFMKIELWESIENKED